jgi:hypothetical protein
VRIRGSSEELPFESFEPSVVGIAVLRLVGVRHRSTDEIAVRVTKSKMHMPIVIIPSEEFAENVRPRFAPSRSIRFGSRRFLAERRTLTDGDRPSRPFGSRV